MPSVAVAEYLLCLCASGPPLAQRSWQRQLRFRVLSDKVAAKQRSSKTPRRAPDVANIDG